MVLVRKLLAVAAVTTERTCRSELTKFVTNHVLSNVDRNELVAVVYSNCVTYEIG